MKTDGFAFAFTVFAIYIVIAGGLVVLGRRLDRRYVGKHRKGESHAPR